jgi:ubiquinone/menaquinone biosynthesis C-methylase UbiE
MYADKKYSWFWPPAYDPQPTPSEVEAVISLLDAQPGTRLLDLACGQGWLTIPLAQRGLQVTGFDLSAALLGRAQDTAQQAGVEIEWIRGDMRHLPSEWNDHFDNVAFTLSEFGCFSDESDNQRVLDEVARVLKRGGRFLLDVVVNRDGLVHYGEIHEFLEGDGFFVAETGTLDLVTGIHKRVYNWYDEGERRETQWQIRAYTPPEVAHMLEKAGFQVLSVYGNLAGAKLARDSWGMAFVAQK